MAHTVLQTGVLKSSHCLMSNNHQANNGNSKYFVQQRMSPTNPDGLLLFFFFFPFTVDIYPTYVYLRIFSFPLHVYTMTLVWQEPTPVSSVPCGLRKREKNFPSRGHVSFKCLSVKKCLRSKQIKPRAGFISVPLPPEMWPLFPPRTGSCFSTPARCHLSPRGHQCHTVEAQHRGTLEGETVITRLLLIRIPRDWD